MKENNVLNDLALNYEHIYIACGQTDLRRGIDGLVSIIQANFNLNPYDSSMFLFCGTKLDRIKVIVHDRDGFTMLYKRLENGKFKWPRTDSDARELTLQQFKWLTEGLNIEQPKALKPAGKMTYA